MGHPFATLLGHWRCQMPLWSSCTPADVEQTRGTGELSAVTGLWPHSDYGDVVGQLPWLECCHEGLHSAEEGQTRNMQKWICPLHEATLGICWALSQGRWQARWELMVRMKELTGKDDTGAGVCSRPLEQGENVDEDSYRELETASQSQTLVLVGEFHYPGIRWRSTNSPGHSWKALMVTSYPW